MRHDMMSTDEAIITGMDINIEWQLRPWRDPKLNNADIPKNKKLKRKKP
tara:strand:- start:984 stop:1130 length:147 start_codon:yes stop_codon:yes gene_type:complete